MPTLSYIRGKIDLIEDDELRVACQKIFTAVSERLSRHDQLSLNFASLSRISGLKADSPVLQASIAFLVGKKDARLLEVHFLFFDPFDDNAEGVPVDDAEVSDAYRTGYLIHPRTGEKLGDFERWLGPYFEPNHELSAP